MVTDTELIVEMKEALARQAKRITKLENDLERLDVLCRGG